MSGKKSSETSLVRHKANVDRLVRRKITVAELVQASPINVLTDPAQQFAAVMGTLFQPDEIVELTTAHCLQKHQKPIPVGNGHRQRAADWSKMAQSGEHLSALGKCEGVFMTINPVDGTRPGSGKNGYTTDDDVAAFRFALVEHDEISKEDQLSLLANLKLPIAAIVDSGGKSLHAWVSMNAPDRESFALRVQQLFALLHTHLGFDSANRNPSRLTRAPGFMRIDNPTTVRQQTLLYLNPKPDTAPIINLIA